jgi:hypothetical protein
VQSLRGEAGRLGLPDACYLGGQSGGDIPDITRYLPDPTKVLCAMDVWFCAQGPPAT